MADRKRADSERDPESLPDVSGMSGTNPAPPPPPTPEQSPQSAHGAMCQLYHTGAETAPPVFLWEDYHTRGRRGAQCSTTGAQFVGWRSVVAVSAGKEGGGGGSQANGRGDVCPTTAAAVAPAPLPAPTGFALIPSETLRPGGRSPLVWVAATASEFRMARVPDQGPALAGVSPGELRVGVRALCRQSTHAHFCSRAEATGAIDFPRGGRGAGGGGGRVHGWHTSNSVTACDRRSAADRTLMSTRCFLIWKGVRGGGQMQGTQASLDPRHCLGRIPEWR